MDLPVSIAVWHYLKEDQKVTNALPELIFWTLVDQSVFSISSEISPVKAEGEVLYIRPGAAFNNSLSPLEEIFRMPFQTRVASRLKLKNYITQVLRILKSNKEIEKNFILPELKVRGLFKSGWLDRLTGKNKIVHIPMEYGIVFDERIIASLKHKELYKFVDKEWDSLT